MNKIRSMLVDQSIVGEPERRGDERSEAQLRELHPIADARDEAARGSRSRQGARRLRAQATPPRLGLHSAAPAGARAPITRRDHMAAATACARSNAPKSTCSVGKTD